MYDVVVVGAGPAGLSAAHAAQSAGLQTLVIDKGCIASSIYRYPPFIKMFSTPELLELADIPLVIRGDKPMRQDILNYYRRFVMAKQLQVKTYQTVKDITGGDGAFDVATETGDGRTITYATRKVILATGAYDTPRMLNIPGEELDKVSHYYSEAHPFYNQDVLVVGGKNSAAEAALELYRSGARVTLSYRGERLHGIKYWVQPDLENRIKEGSIIAYFQSHLTRIEAGSATLTLANDRTLTLDNDFVFCMTGYRPDPTFFKRIGIGLDETTIPTHSPETFETNIPGIYVVGVVTAGEYSDRVFIENGRLHGPRAVAHIQTTLRTETADVSTYPALSTSH